MILEQIGAAEVAEQHVEARHAARIAFGRGAVRPRLVAAGVDSPLFPAIEVSGPSVGPSLTLDHAAILPHQPAQRTSSELEI